MNVVCIFDEMSSQGGAHLYSLIMDLRIYGYIFFSLSEIYRKNICPKYKRYMQLHFTSRIWILFKYNEKKTNEKQTPKHY